MLLDEPTTFLDVGHQLEVLDLLGELNQIESRTIVIVLRDLNEACRYVHHLIAMKDGRIIAEGSPRELVTESLIAEVFGIRCSVMPDPVTGRPLFISHARTPSQRIDAVEGRNGQGHSAPHEQSFSALQ